MVVLAALGSRRRPCTVTRANVSFIGAGGVMAGIWLAVLACCPAGVPRLVGVPHNRAWALASLAWALAIVVGLVLLCSLAQFRARPRMNGLVRGALVGTVVVLDVFAMFVIPQFSAPRQASIDTHAVNYLEQHLGQSRFFTLGPLAPDYGSYFGLASVPVNDVPVPKTYVAFIQDQLDTNVNPLIFSGTTMLNPAGPTQATELVDHIQAYEEVGVKYVLLPAGMVLPSHGGLVLRQAFRDASTSIVELPHPAPLFGSSGGACTVRQSSATSVVVGCKRRSTIVYRAVHARMARVGRRRSQECRQRRSDLSICSRPRRDLDGEFRLYTPLRRPGFGGVHPGPWASDSCPARRPEDLGSRPPPSGSAGLNLRKTESLSHGLSDSDGLVRSVSELTTCQLALRPEHHHHERQGGDGTQGEDNDYPQGTSRWQPPSQSSNVCPEAGLVAP